MAVKYSNLFERVGSFRGTSAGVDAATAGQYAYKGPYPKETNELVQINCTFPVVATTGTVTTSDSINLCQVPKGWKTTNIILSSGDDDLASAALTINLGYTGALTALISAGSQLAAGAETTLGAEELEEVAVTTDEAFITLTPAANSLDQTGTLYVQIQGYIP